MIPQITLTTARTDLFPLAKLASDNDIAKILRQSISDILRKYRTWVRRNLARRLDVPQRIITPRVRVSNVSVRDIRAGILRAELWVGTYRIPIIKTLRGGSRLTRGRGSLTVSRTKSGRGGYSLSRGAFLAQMPGGKAGVFVRSPKARTATGRDARGRVRRGRLPIQELKLDVAAAAEQLLRELIERREFIDEVGERFERKLEQYANG